MAVQPHLGDFLIGPSTSSFSTSTGAFDLPLEQAGVVVASLSSDYTMASDPTTDLDFALLHLECGRSFGRLLDVRPCRCFTRSRERREICVGFRCVLSTIKMSQNGVPTYNLKKGSTLGCRRHPSCLIRRCSANRVQGHVWFRERYKRSLQEQSVRIIISRMVKDEGVECRTDFGTAVRRFVVKLILF